MMHRYAGLLETGAMFKLLSKLFLAGAFLAAVCWVALQFIFTPAAQLPEWKKIVDVAITIAVASTVFFGVAFLLRVDELRDVVDLIRRRFRS
jgi:hypothetical protein